MTFQEFPSCVQDAPTARVVPRGHGRASWPLILVLVVIALGAVVHAWNSARERRAARRGFPILLRLQQPLKIDMHWRPRLVQEASGAYGYTGPASFILHNDSEETILVRLPPQACFTYSEGQMARRGQVPLPEWANQEATITLRPDERRTFEGSHSSTTFEPIESSVYSMPGPYGFDFAAPLGQDSEGYITGTVFAWKAITLE